ncbi:MBL fold metallo-hydrolase [Demetria terragena]|uniref:MBL fold metallo-hydrolase n=1 Tax=Demetria terragena TaxID=63959 RepID=UPI000366EEE0|nr:MBL fold metallo-hydrolase [Demetria terragena]
MAMRVITLGTAGGPRWWPPVLSDSRWGISTAVEVDGRVYLVDVGHGAGRQFTRAGLEMSDLGAVFLTHLHSDHTTDLANLALFGLFTMSATSKPVPIIGPGDRGALPPVSPLATVPPDPVAPHRPTPGTADLFRLLMEAHATDLNDRVLDALRPNPQHLFAAQDIVIPPEVGFDANACPTPAMQPFTVFEDDRIRVDATLVEHPPIAPAYGFRLTSEHGSVAISGDTTRTDNMVRLAQDVDLLLHEAISFEWVEGLYADRTDATSRASVSHHRRSHTSVTDAVAVAEQAGAGSLALHHLVPGNRDTDLWRAATAGASLPVLIPDDLDVLPIGRTPPVTC